MSEEIKIPTVISNFKVLETSIVNITAYKTQYSNLRHVKVGHDFKGMLLIDSENDRFVAVLQCNVKTNYIVAIEVSSQYRGKGIASKLLHHAIKTFGCDKLTVNKNNKEAIELYLHKGWRVVKEEGVMYYMEYPDTKAIENMKTVFASFAVVTLKNNLIYATTRDGNDVGRIGLPGGKCDPNENPEETARREAAEEGLYVEGKGTLINEDIVEDRLVHWYHFKKATPLKNYKEKARGIKVITVPIDTIAKSGYGNDFLLNWQHK